MTIFNQNESTSADPAEESGLVERAALGNREAFERLAQIYVDSLWRYAARILSNPEEAKDVVQQTLLQMYQALPTLKEPERFRPWLFKIAHNKCHDQLRRANPLTFSEWSDTPAQSSPINLPDQAPLPEEVIERRETQHLLREAISALPEPQRQVAALRYAAELSFAEIGAVLGLKESTVKTLFQRAKPQLRFYLRQRL